MHSRMINDLLATQVIFSKEVEAAERWWKGGVALYTSKGRQLLDQCGIRCKYM